MKIQKKNVQKKKKKFENKPGWNAGILHKVK